MILSYKQKFPWGAPTYFREQIQNGINKNSQFIIKTKDKPDVVIDNEKIHSIRDDVHNRWKPGMIIQHAYGVRTKQYNCFATGQCISTQILELKAIDWRDAVQNPREIKAIESMSDKEPKVFQLFVDGRRLNGAEIHDIARNDGFDSTEDFFRWFDKPCIKKIIHFTDFKY